MANSADHDALARWFQAAKKGNQGALMELVGAVDVNACDPRGYTALFMAAAPWGGIPSLVAWLLSVGADPNARSRDHETVPGYALDSVCSALERGEAERIRELVRDAGFRGRPDDAAPFSRSLSRIERALAGLEEGSIERVAVRLCRSAARSWQEALPEGLPLGWLDRWEEARGVSVAPDLVERALAAASASAAVHGLREELEPAARVLADDRCGVTEEQRVGFLAVYNLYRRNALGEPVSLALIVQQALGGHRREMRDEALRVAVEG